MVERVKKYICDVCKKPGAHKHRYQYCILCLAETVHVTPIFGLPWVCKNSHPDDNKKCARCRNDLKPLELGGEMCGSGKKFYEECSELIEALLQPAS